MQRSLGHLGSLSADEEHFLRAEIGVAAATEVELHGPILSVRGLGGTDLAWGQQVRVAQAIAAAEQVIMARRDERSRIGGPLYRGGR